MMKLVRLVVNHPKWDKPVIHERLADAPSMSSIMKMFQLSGRQFCELKNKGQTAWRDHRGVSHILSLTDAPEAPAQAPNPTERKQGMFSKIKDKSCQLLLQLTEPDKHQIRVPLAK